MMRFLPLVPVLLALVACGEGRQSYYQTRTTPVSTADAYGTTAKMAWGDNSNQVYELPVPIPDQAGEAPPRIDCTVPGPQFKSRPMVAWGMKPNRSYDNGDLYGKVGTKLDRPQGDAIDFHRHPKTSVRARLDQPGIDQFAYTAKPGATDHRPVSTTGAGIDYHKPRSLVGYNNNTNPYCEHEEGAGAMPVDPYVTTDDHLGVAAPSSAK